MTKKIIYNCHTHTFTIDHVPNEFSKKMIPGLYWVFTMRFIKWYYKYFTSRGNPTVRKWRYKFQTLRYAFIGFLKWTIVLQWINLLFCFLARWVFNVITNFFRVDFLFSKRTREATKRFATLGRYSLYKEQHKIFDLLAKTYEDGTRFVVLAMDMDYMAAGKAAKPYLQQLNELKILKQNNPDTILPFLFLDPRRLEETKKLEGNHNYEIFSRELLSTGKFDGIKLYPALGYYPFDKELISMYEFAQENQIPITTHCIAGTVYYRGEKSRDWNTHPILKYPKKKNMPHEPIPLPQTINYDFTTNFTHPLNYHCLLNKELLKEYLGYELDLSNLKICIAHFGGEEEWEKYKADGWNNYNKNISHGSREEYLKKIITLNHGNQRTIWWNASWLSVIYDLMVTYDNVYADVSFILFNQELFPMLKYLLEDEKVKDKILFGTDYYVVTQKNTEKELYHTLRGYLGETLFNLISHENPKKFLSTKWKQF